MDKKGLPIGSPVVSVYKLSKRTTGNIFGILNSIEESTCTIEVANFEDGKHILSSFVACKKYHTKLCDKEEVHSYNAKLCEWSKEVSPVK